MKVKNVYETSKNIENIDIVVSDKAKDFYKILLLCDTVAKSRQLIANKLCAELCKCLNIKPVEVKVCNVPQDSKIVNGVCVSRTKGKYIPSQNMMVIFNKTAVRKKIVAIKDFSDTLLHVFVHHLDYKYYNFGDSPHTSGFFKRISCLKEKIK